MSLAQLRYDRQQLLDQANSINHQFQNRAMPADKSQELDVLLSQIEGVDARLDVIKGSTPNASTSWKNADNEAVKTLRTASEIKAHYAEKFPADRTTSGIKLDDFVRGVAGMKTSVGVQNALSVGTDSAGGHLVPGLIMADILAALVPASSLLNAGAQILPLGEGAKTFTTVALDVIPSASWRLESGAVSMSDPAFRPVIAAPKSLAFYFKVSREILADAANLSQALTIAIAQSFARELDRAGLLGTGTNPEPRGILNTAGISAISNGANGLSLTNYANFFSGLNAILSLNAPAPTAAIMTPRSLTKLGGLLDSTGQPITAPSMLQGVKLLTTTAISNSLTVGTSTDCSQIFMGDFSKVTFAMREQLSIQLLDQTFATSGEIGFMCHCRADVMLTYPAAFSLITGVRA